MMDTWTSGEHICAGQSSFLLFFLLSSIITIPYRHYDEPTSYIIHTQIITRTSYMTSLSYFSYFLLYFSGDLRGLFPQLSLYNINTLSPVKFISVGLYFPFGQLSLKS